MTVLRSPLRSVLRSSLYSQLVGKWGGVSPAAFLSGMFANGEVGWVRIPMAGVGVAYQERTGASATTVSASGDVCGTFHDLITGGYWTASADSRRPVYTAAAGLRYLDYDGIDDCLAGPTTNLGTARASIAIAYEVDTTGVQLIEESSPSFLTSEPAFSVVSGDVTGSISFGVNGSGGSANGRRDQSATPPRKVAALSELDLGGSTFATIFPTFIVNGVTPTITNVGTAAGGGTFGNFVPYSGARGDSSLRFNGRVFASLVINRAFTADEKTYLTTLFASLSGVTLP